MYSMIGVPAALSLTGIVSAFAAAVAVMISLIAFFRSRQAERYVRFHESVDNAYSGFDSLSNLRIDHWEQSHLLELPQNYDLARAALTQALGPLTEERALELQIRERAIATRIFTFYEQTVYCYSVLDPADQPRADFSQAVLKYFNEHLLANPRLRYLWQESGGNLRVYFEQDTIAAYENSAALRLSQAALDAAGPFQPAGRGLPAARLHNTGTAQPGNAWSKQPGNAWGTQDRKRYWEGIHGEDNYDNVLSLTEDAELRKLLIEQLDCIPSGEILILGCGSRTALERALIDAYPGLKVTCTDFAGVVNKAQARFKHANVDYVAANSVSLPWQERFDAVLVVNSILSDSDEENRAMLRSSFQALRAGGRLIGYFPTIFASFEIALLTADPERHAMIDVHTATKYEPKQDAPQIFYPPLRLRQILRETGFVLKRMEVIFLDSEYMRQQSRELDAIESDDTTVIYEHFIVATRPPADPPRAAHSSMRSG